MEQALRKEQLNALYEQYGYCKFRMSRFEDYDLYARNRDFLKDGSIVTFTDANGSLKALRPDITLSIIKNSTGAAEKLYYNENVYREIGGAFQEILQVGVESVGQIDPYAEAEVIALAARSLQSLSEDYVLDVSDVGLLDCLLCGLGLTQEQKTQVLPLIAHKNEPGIVLLAEQGRLTGAEAEAICGLVRIYAPLKEGIARVGELAGDSANRQALRQLAAMTRILDAFGLQDDRFRLDFSLVNSMDYYNGVIFQGFLPQIPFAVLSGGRYDNLPRKMGKQVGAIGFALYMGRLEQYFQTERPYDAELLLSYGPDADLTQLAALAEELRSRGCSVRCTGEPGSGGDGARCRRAVRYTPGLTAQEVLG